MSKKVHAEIEYVKSDGTPIHSDICPPGCLAENMNDVKWRKFIHDCLDEWLNNSNGSGGFYIKEENFNGFGI